MERTTGYLLGALFGIIIIAVAIITALGKDAAALTGFLGTIIVPSLVALFAGDQAKKSRKAAESAEAASTQAAEASTQAVHNTNGRMTELIQIIQSQGGQVPPGYEEFMSPEQAAVTPVSAPTPTNWQPFTD